MIPLGLSAADQGTFEESLAHSHWQRTHITVLDRDEKVLGPLDVQLLSGAVQVDATADVGRALDLTILDPGAHLRFIPNAPYSAGIYADNFLAVTYGVYVAALARWIDVPVFWGPLETVERDGPTIQISAKGKEALGLAPALAWQPQTIQDGALVTKTIRSLLGAQGETRYSLPQINTRIRGDVSLARTSEPWKLANKVAHGANRQLFYDGRGRARLRHQPGRPAFRFLSGEGGTLTTRPKVTYDVTRVRNVIEVLGPAPSSSQQKRLRAVAIAPRSHPLSPWSLSRNGEPRWLVESIDASNAKTQKDVNDLADQQLTNLLKAEVAIDFSTLVIPHLEEGDLVAVASEGLSISFRLSKFTIPLTSSETMSVGTLKRVKVKRRAA